MQVSNLWSDLLIDQILGNVNLSQGQLVMVFVVQHVHKIGIEWMDVLKKKKQHETKHILTRTTRRNKIKHYSTREILHGDLRQVLGSR